MAGEQGTDIVGESGSSTMSPEASHAEAVEAKATKSGWRPLDEWKGDPGDWVDAREYVGRQPLYDRIKDLSHSLTEQRRAFEADFGRVSKHMADVEKRAQEKAIRELRADRRIAIEEKDPDAVEMLDKEIAVAQTQLAEAETLAKTAVKTSPGETPELKRWKEENAWFEKDKELQEEAVAIGIGRSASKPNESQADILEFVAKRIRKLFPEKFNDDEDDTVEEKAPKSKVEGGNRAAGGSGVKKGKLTRADLSDQQVSVMKTLIKRNVLADAAKKNNRTQEAEYLSQLETALTV